LKVTIYGHGSPECFLVLARELRREGVSVEWDPPDRVRGDFIEAVAASMVAAGAFEVIKAVVTRLSSGFQDLRVEKDDESD
jgi:hypothetical protein